MDSTAAQQVSRSVAESILISPKFDSTMANPREVPNIPLEHQHGGGMPPKYQLPVRKQEIPPNSNSQNPQQQGGVGDTTSLLNNMQISSDGRSGGGQQMHDDHDQQQVSNLFIGDLSRTVTEEQLRNVFSKHGNVLSVDIKRDKRTHNNLGYGFVQFATRDQAVLAKQQLNGVDIGNRKIRIGWAQKNTTLFIGDLDGSITTRQLRDIFSKYGDLVEDETFVRAGSGRYGFVRYKHRSDAEKAKAEMNRKLIGSRCVRIGWGDNNIQKHCVHVQFNPSLATHLEEVDLKRLFEPFGSVVSVSLPRYPNRRLKGYGFVHFEDSQEGEQAAGKAIASLAETKVQDVLIRCSYGKRQVFRRRTRPPNRFPRPFGLGFGRGSGMGSGMGFPSSSGPMTLTPGFYATTGPGGSAYLMQLGPTGEWTPVQIAPQGNSSTGVQYTSQQMNPAAVFSHPMQQQQSFQQNAYYQIPQGMGNSGNWMVYGDYGSSGFDGQNIPGGQSMNRVGRDDTAPGTGGGAADGDVGGDGEPDGGTDNSASVSGLGGAGGAPQSAVYVPMQQAAGFYPQQVYMQRNGYGYMQPSALSYPQGPSVVSSGGDYMNMRGVGGGNVATSGAGNISHPSSVYLQNNQAALLGNAANLASNVSGGGMRQDSQGAFFPSMVHGGGGMTQQPSPFMYSPYQSMPVQYQMQPGETGQVASAGLTIEQLDEVATSQDYIQKYAMPSQMTGKRESGEDVTGQTSIQQSGKSN